jgi:methyl-accepting chemotaxis protein
VASDNPLNPDNQAEALEQAILDRFRSDRTLESLIEKGILKDQNFLISAQPSISNSSCLACHETSAKAPPEIVKQYGTKSGFGYEPDQVVGGIFVGVPLGNVNQTIFNRSLLATTLLTVFFSILFLSVNQLVQRLILNPLTQITQAACEVSQGNLEQNVDLKRQDEIGDLANAFELMRRSLITATNRLRKNLGKQ